MVGNAFGTYLDWRAKKALCRAKEALCRKGPR